MKKLSLFDAFRLALLILIGLCFQACPKPDAQEFKKQVQQKVFAALKCDSNSDISGVKINSLSADLSNENTYNFVGTYVGKLVIKYEGSVNGIASFKEHKIVLQLVHYETKITSGDISYTCLNNE